MPTYAFKNQNTGEIEEYRLSFKELDTFKEQNPHLERYFSPENLPILSDATRLSVPGTHKADSTFQKYVIDRIKETVPGNTLKNAKTSTPREW